MAKYHVHVYKLAGLCEVAVDASSPQDAMKQALAQAKGQEFQKPDAEYMAIPYEVTGYSMGMTTEQE